MEHHLLEIGGVRMSRREDLRLITGAGKYASDWNLPGQLHATFLRADRAHANIVSVNTEAAEKHPGVVRVFTGEDAMRSGYTKPMTMLTFKGRGGMEVLRPERPVLAHGKVRCVGEPVAMVVAESALIAQDAAELIEVEYEELPVVIDPEAALAPGAPQLHDNVPGNVPFDFEAGDAGATEAAFAKAAHVTRLKLAVTRVAPNPMEPRACLVAYDAGTDMYTVHVHVQGVNMMRKQLAAYTGLPEEKFRIMAHDVGGAFGQRSLAYPEYCMQLLAAKQLGRPVKWIATRSEGFMTDSHGRANYVSGELALDKDGKFLGARLDWIADMGAYLTPTGPVSHLRNPSTCLTGVYRIPALYGRWRTVLTNTNPIAAYRGAGRPDVAYVIERLVSQAAADLKMDAAEIRRRNFIPPEAFPYKTPTGSTYENADLPGVLEKALKLADWNGFANRRRQSEKAGKLRGIGIATVIENTGAGLFPRDEVQIEVAAGGTVTAYTVSHSQGQGHETSFAMIVAETLGIAFERVQLRQGDEDHPLFGNHTGGSRSTVGAGSACHLAARKLIEEGRALAALELDAEPSQVEYANGSFRGGESKRTITLADLAKSRVFSVTAQGSFSSTFPNGCHIAEVEIDPDTGVTEIASYVTVDDCGRVINHTIVEGQMHGGVAQGAGQVFGEHVVYDRDSGQLMTGSFADYYMPRAGLVREITMEEHPTPSKVSPLGVKGMGESGCTASLPALTNAVLDALRPLGVQHLDMPLTPAKVWHAIQAARTKQ
ncbi:MAG: xanthine dehydrogenase family protein molybdopterin-binding subunit [Betaproteobacteria bacterium]|nr:xanthine dehydrogenase family protein molybdopterin-binding subunit [Betaproteobacteria bacterium]